MKKPETITVKMSKDNATDLEVGDTIGTTTSTFDYDSYDCLFSNDVNTIVTLKAIHVFKDYRDYVQGKHQTGGCYGFDKWMVTKILDKHFI